MNMREAMNRMGLGVAILGVVLGATAPAGAQDPCEVTDNGTGTVTLPPAGCAYLSPDQVHMIMDGLPAGTEILLDVIHVDFICEQPGIAQELCNFPDGTGGEVETFQSTLQIQMTGTGGLLGFSRQINISAFCEIHTGPRNPGDPVQTFPTEMFQLQGGLPPGDPDFAQLTIVAGQANGLPSPGQTTLTQLPTGNFNVDSFFDVFYQIDFQGTPTGALANLTGSTTGTVRMIAAGSACKPTPDGSSCVQVACQDPTGLKQCAPKCVNYDPTTGQVKIVECQCQPFGECQVDMPGTPVKAVGSGNACVVPDDTTGTVTLPPVGCAYLSPDEFHTIVDGLPAGTTIEMAPIHKDFICNRKDNAGCPPPGLCEGAGGSLGGNVDCFDSTLALTLNGTGTLAGFSRSISIPVQCQIHTAPRTPGAPVQDFDTEMFMLQGQILGDPDFDLLKVTGGQGFGLPSPGHTTLTRQGPAGSDFAVDSFFDVTYQIDFQGAPGSVLDGLAGSTTATIRMKTGGPPSCVGTCPAGTVCKETRTPNPDGVTIDVCCRCEPEPVVDCRPLADGSACAPFNCSAGQECVPVAVHVDPASGQVTVLACECKDIGECRVAPPATPGTAVRGVGGAGNPCVVPDDTTGTVTLPPIGCAYLSPDEFHTIVDGLPAGTTIEMAPIHKDFICLRQDSAGCPPPGLCEGAGGSLGGNVDCFDSTLALTLNGTGTLAGFSRTISIPVQCQIHTAPRNPGDSVQDFDTEMFMLQGQIFGDPDFDLLKVTAGQGFGLPSPGHTTLTQLPTGDFNVDSFFDITYRIDFQGAPGSVLGTLGGSTTATIRMQTGAPLGCVGGCPAPLNCEGSRTLTPNGGLVLQCQCKDNFQAIPTVSQWGMVTMTLMIIAAAGAILLRRRMTAAS